MYILDIIYTQSLSLFFSLFNPHLLLKLCDIDSLDNYTMPHFVFTQDTLEYIFIGIFWVESIVKIIAQGFMCHHGSYLRSFWNVLDFFIVIVG